MSDTAIIDMLICGNSDLEWYDANLNLFKSKYNNKFIAFQNKKILETDSNLDNLMAKLKEKSIDTSNVFIKFISKIKSIL